jgi:hypothetical protein
VSCQPGCSAEAASRQRPMRSTAARVVIAVAAGRSVSTGCAHRARRSGL